jgi:hypothetical protein
MPVLIASILDPGRPLGRLPPDHRAKIGQRFDEIAPSDEGLLPNGSPEKNLGTNSGGSDVHDSNWSVLPNTRGTQVA